MRLAFLPVIASLVVAPMLGAQTARPADSAFTDLRRDGNGLSPLLAPIAAGFDRQPADVALRTVAALAHLNLTYDPHLPGLTTPVTIAAHNRTAAAALLEIAESANVRVRVAASGQLVVVAPAPPAATKAPAAEKGPVELPGMRTQAERLERREFQSTATIGAVSVTGSELRNTPVFVEPDVLRAIQMLPGVGARSDYTAGFNVRGGENDQNLVLLDGYPIYNPYHLGGVFSTFIDPTVGHVDLLRGGLPSRYGGRLSGVLDVQSADATRTDLTGAVEVSLVSSIGSIGRAFSDGSGSWMIAARRTYADAVVNLVHPGGFPYHFQDIQGHVSKTLGNRVRVSLTAYDGLDTAVDPQNPGTSSNWGNAVVGATIEKSIDRPRVFGATLGDSVRVAQRASVTRFDSNFDAPDEIFHAVDRVTDHRLGGSATLFGGALTHTLGYELSSQRLAYFSNADLIGLSDLIPFDSSRQTARSISGFANELWRVSPKLLVEGGLRVDDVRQANWTGLSPRISLKYFLKPNTAITAAGGRYAQWMHSLGREEEPVQPLQFWVASDSLLPVSRARDVTLGLERWVTPSRLLHIEAFHKTYDNLMLPNRENDPAKRGDEFTPLRGTSYGLDFLLRQLDGGSFSGWLAYTYLFNTRTQPDGFRYAPPQDRRHNLNAVGSWHAGAVTWNMHVALASGLPFTEVLGGFQRGVYDPISRTWRPDFSSSDDQNISGPLGGSRLPFYDRIDVSATRAMHIGSTPVSAYLSVLNVLNSHNPAGYHYTFTNVLERASIPNLPFMPTFGVSIAY